MRKIFIWTVLLASLFFAFQDDCRCDAAQYFNDRAKFNPPQSNSSDWMATLDDRELLSHITIPGSHDTMARYGDPAVKCQAWGLKDQLIAGIRYLDVRTACLGGLKIVPRPVCQKATFTDVIKVVEDFLKVHKTETVLLRVKPELFFKGRVKEGVQRAIQGHDNIVVESTIPTIGEVRGKIVLVQNAKFDLGIPVTGTDTAGDYKVINSKAKKDKIMIHLREAMKQCGKDKVMLSYSSGTGLDTRKGMTISPEGAAREINPWLHSYLGDLKKNIMGKASCFGVIAMDFPGFDLIRMVIELNR